MNWIILAISAHFLTAIVFILDKIIVSKTVIRPVIYSFYVGFLGLAAIFLAPFGFELLAFREFVISFVAGITFPYATLFLYKSIKISEVSKIIPIIGGAIAFFTLVFTYIFLEERLNSNQFVAFFLLVFGGTIILWPKKEKEKKHLFSFNEISFALLSAFLFALSYTLTKLLFTEETFINGFIWIKIGSFIGVCLFLISAKNRKKIFGLRKSINLKILALPTLSKTLSSSSFVIINYAIYLGNVSLVNALQGIQYVFILAIASFLSIRFPKIIKEEINKGSLFKKVFGILFVCLGLIFLVL